MPLHHVYGYQSLVSTSYNLNLIIANNLEGLVDRDDLACNIKHTLVPIDRERQSNACVIAMLFMNTKKKNQIENPSVSGMILTEQKNPMRINHENRVSTHVLFIRNKFYVSFFLLLPILALTSFICEPRLSLIQFNFRLFSFSFWFWVDTQS